MKRFLIHVTLCFIILVVICMIPCLIFEKKAKECTKTAPYSKINLVSNLNRADADVIIVGNSRAEYSYNDSILSALTGKKCLNIGLSGYSFEFQYHVMYKRYLAHNNIPKFVILEVGLSHFLNMRATLIALRCSLMSIKTTLMHILICVQS